MPSKKKCQKTNIGYYKPRKRKVISPIKGSEHNSGVTVDKGGQGNSSGQLSGQSDYNCVSPDNSDREQVKRFHQSSPDYFNFRPYANMSMNFPSMPFGNQFMQSPPFNSQFPASGTPSNIQAPPPQWATEIMEDIKSIKLSVSKIDNIEKMVNKISSKVDNLETKVKTIDSRVSEVEKSKEFLSSGFDDTKEKLKRADSDLKRLTNKCKDFEESMKNLATQNETLEAKANDLEARSLRENLLFHGINETQNENCETLVKQFIAEKLNVTQDVTIDRAHRLGKPRNKTRPIVVKFHYYTERELVRNRAFEKSAELKATNQGVGVQQTKSVLQKRRDLSAVFDREKAAGRSVKWAGARLMVRDGNVGEFREVKE